MRKACSSFQTLHWTIGPIIGPQCETDGNVPDNVIQELLPLNPDSSIAPLPSRAFPYRFPITWYNHYYLSVSLLIFLSHSTNPSNSSKQVFGKENEGGTCEWLAISLALG